ncbi:MAG TPA: GNAT family N-acetyltransferase [Anaerolineales bacterium]|nr:GNAT family N-acetyltransferase [Anaerolineales bacterium]
MDTSEFRAFVDRSAVEYAEAKVQSGNWTASGAEERARQEQARLLPQGQATPAHHFFAIEHEGQPAGGIWLCTDPKVAGGAGYIFDLFVNEDARRKGVGRQAMLLLETEAARLGLKSLALHVFGHNLPARALYEKLGYSVTNINMSKPIGGE